MKDLWLFLFTKGLFFSNCVHKRVKICVSEDLFFAKIIHPTGRACWAVHIRPISNVQEMSETILFKKDYFVKSTFLQSLTGGATVSKQQLEIEDIWINVTCCLYSSFHSWSCEHRAEYEHLSIHHCVIVKLSSMILAIYWLVRSEHPATPDVSGTTDVGLFGKISVIV